ncbi:MAG TPA: monofunctional biosynthetic peptidoglycan transglycosylase [Sphingobium sp.]|nr:monofunctional biosynthetic peptidoglycan transglycosylase [Sphingobium sp.]
MPAPSSAPRRRARWLGILLRILGGFVAFSLLIVLIYRFVPPPVTLTMLFDPHGITKDWVSLDDIDPNMARAAIAAEDSRFCSHHGFDAVAIANALRHNASGGRIHGGSTISQQAAKNVFLFQGGGFLRKGFEAWFTMLIEAIWGKRRIMEVYLNVAETGIGTYGVQAAAMRYFHHGAAHLTRAEAARVAAVLPLPKKRAAIDPRGFTRRYGNSIVSRIGVVQRDGLDRCVR